LILFILSLPLQVGGLGLTLTAANRVVIVEPLKRVLYLDANESTLVTRALLANCYCRCRLAGWA
jgi:hypothetical protein